MANLMAARHGTQGTSLGSPPVTRWPRWLALEYPLASRTVASPGDQPGLHSLLKANFIQRATPAAVVWEPVPSISRRWKDRHFFCRAVVMMRPSRGGRFGSSEGNGGDGRWLVRFDGCVN